MDAIETEVLNLFNCYRMEKWLNQKTEYRGTIFSVVSGEVVVENGKIEKREIVQHKGSVAIVPIIDNSVILVSQFRISAEKEILEIPAGRIETGEKPSAAAQRELQEETGYKSLELVPGPTYYTSVGFVNEQVNLFFAFELVKLDEPTKGDENICIKKFSFSEIEQQLDLFKFDDSKTIIGLREVITYLQNKKTMINAKDLYTWYSEENHKYNTIIWQFPTAILGLNTFAVGGLYLYFSKLVLWQQVFVLSFMFLLNITLLYTVAKHTYHQRGFTESLKKLLKKFKKDRPELIDYLVEFKEKKGIYKIFELKATWVLVIGLAILNLAYVAYLIIILA